MKTPSAGSEFLASTDPEWSVLQGDAAWGENEWLALRLEMDEIAGIRRLTKEDQQLADQWMEMVNTWLDVSGETGMPVRAAMQLARVAFIDTNSLTIRYDLPRLDLAA